MGYSRLGDKAQDEVFGLFLRLCKDETPLVRRMAAQSLEHWTKLLDSSTVKQQELINAFKAFIHDDQVQYSTVQYIYYMLCANLKQLL